MRLKDTVSIITGGAGGIGQVAAKLFASEGSRVIIADYDVALGEQVAEEIASQTRASCLFVQVNVADPDSVQQMVQQVMDEFGKIDVLINNAGITRDAMLKKLTVQDWQRVLDVNLSGVFYCTQAVLPHMVEQGRGSVINTSSIVGLQGNIGQTNYAATKSGIIGLTKTWAKELGPKGIRVNAVAPGFIATSMVTSVPEKILEQLRANVPLRRLGQPEDIAQAYLYLASDESSYVNGTILQVDGGLVI